MLEKVMFEFENYKKFQVFKGKTILCLDYGEKIVGLATFTPGREPYPITRGKIENKGMTHIISEVNRIIEEDIVEIIIFGIPYHTDGSASEKTKKMLANFEYIKKQIQNVEWFAQDETLSTFEAKKRMENSPEYNYKVDIKKVDEISAVVILEDFIKS